MELNMLEVHAMEETIVEANEGQLRELNDLQLAYVGGGIGETHL